MEKLFKNIIYKCLCFVCIFSFIYPAVSCIAYEDCECPYCPINEEGEQIDYEELEEYEDMFREFEKMVDSEENSQYAWPECKNFISKWSKKVKRWFKKRIVKLLKKMVNLKKYKDPEMCAYTVAKFKRKVNSIHDTGSIQAILEQFDRYCNDPKYKGMDKFAERIEYYYQHPGKKPKQKAIDPNRYNISCATCSKNPHDPNEKNELDEIPVRALIGGIEVGCGCIMVIIPFPPCKWLGSTMIAHGLSQIYEGYMMQYEEDQKKQNEIIHQEFCY